MGVQDLGFRVIFDFPDKDDNNIVRALTLRGYERAAELGCLGRESKRPLAKPGDA
jgi:hypothetical protein